MSAGLFVGTEDIFYWEDWKKGCNGRCLGLIGWLVAWLAGRLYVTFSTLSSKGLRRRVGLINLERVSFIQSMADIEPVSYRKYYQNHTIQLSLVCRKF